MSDGNLTNVVETGGSAFTMGYENVNRLNFQIAGSVRFTYTYDASGLKRYEDAPSGRTTIIWDGTDYLQGRN